MYGLVTRVEKKYIVIFVARLCPYFSNPQFSRINLFLFLTSCVLMSVSSHLSPPGLPPYEMLLSFIDNVTVHSVHAQIHDGCLGMLTHVHSLFGLFEVLLM